MVNEELIVWNPLKQNPFSRFDNELHFVEMHYQKDFVLVFEDIKFSKKYKFTYKQDEHVNYPIITFRFFDEMTRPDIEELISKVEKKRDEEGLSKLTYEPTFYKVRNSRFLSWYDSIYPARVGIQPNAEHHIYISSEYILEVLSEQEPIITIDIFSTK